MSAAATDAKRYVKMKKMMMIDDVNDSDDVVAIPVDFLKVHRLHSISRALNKAQVPQPGSHALELCAGRRRPLAT